MASNQCREDRLYSHGGCGFLPHDAPVAVVLLVLDADLLGGNQLCMPLLGGIAVRRSLLRCVDPGEAYPALLIG